MFAVHFRLPPLRAAATLILAVSIGCQAHGQEQGNDSPAAEELSPRSDSVAVLKARRGNSIVFFLGYSPDGAELAVIHQFGRGGIVWNTATWEHLRPLPPIRMIAYSPDGATMATAEGRDGLRLWKRGSDEAFRTLAGKGGTIRHAAFSPDGKNLASTHDENGVNIWDVETGELRETLEGQVLCTLFSSDGKILITAGSADKAVKFWDTTSWQELRSVTTPGVVTGLTLSPDGTTLVTVNVDKSGSSSLMIWHNTERIGIASLEKGWMRIASVEPGYNCAAFSPDGKTLAMGGSDITLWTNFPARGRRGGAIALDELSLEEFDAGAGLPVENADRKIPVQVMALAYSPDGRTLAAGLHDGSVRLVSMASR